MKLDSFGFFKYQFLSVAFQLSHSIDFNLSCQPLRIVLEGRHLTNPDICTFCTSISRIFQELMRRRSFRTWGPRSRIAWHTENLESPEKPIGTLKNGSLNFLLSYAFITFHRHEGFQPPTISSKVSTINFLLETFRSSFLIGPHP